MSYNVRVVGHLTITPPLVWAEIKRSRFYTSTVDGRNRGNLPDVILQVDSEDVETDLGMNTILSSQFIVPCTEGLYRAYGIVKDVEELYNAFEGHDVRGVLTLWGEEYGFIRRVVADDAGVREEKATLSWPDGSEVELP